MARSSQLVFRMLLELEVDRITEWEVGIEAIDEDGITFPLGCIAVLSFGLFADKAGAWNDVSFRLAGNLTKFCDKPGLGWLDDPKQLDICINYKIKSII